MPTNREEIKEGEKEGSQRRGEELFRTGNSINKSFILERSRNSLFPPPFQPVLEGCNLYSKVSLLSFRAGSRVVDWSSRHGGWFMRYSKRGEEEGLEISLQDRRPRSAEPDLLSAFLKRMERFGYRENQFRSFVGHLPVPSQQTISHPENSPPNI